MIKYVTFERTAYQPPPTHFEAGTANIADAVGLSAALDYLQRIGIENVTRYEHALVGYATQQMQTVPGLRPVGTAPDKASVLSFVLDGYQPEAVGQALNRDGIAVRAGHHCAQAILRRFGLEATVRASLSLHNTCDEVDVRWLRCIAWLQTQVTPGPEAHGAGEPPTGPNARSGSEHAPGRPSA